MLIAVAKNNSVGKHGHQVSNFTKCIMQMYAFISEDTILNIRHNKTKTKPYPYRLIFQVP